MKRTIKAWGSAVLAAGLCLTGCSNEQASLFSSLKNPETIAQLKQFVREKQAQADASTNAGASAFAPFFAAAKKGDWPALNNDFQRLSHRLSQHGPTGDAAAQLRGPRWEAAKEVWGAFDAFSHGDEKYAAAFGRDIIASIPPGSLYFGGTDPGRFLVTALCRSQVAGDPFFVLSQNPLADGSYLQYLHEMYGGKIYLPTEADIHQCFEDYTADLAVRSQNHQLKPGEDFSKDASGRVQITGHIAIMGINGLLAKMIFDQNPDRDFFIAESFPLDWMYPCLEPHGLIFKLNRQPLTTLPDEIVQTDHAYWAKYVQPMIGDWLNQDTSIAEVAAFAEKTFGRRDFSGFTGDRNFIQNAYVSKAFSKQRSAIAGVYAWRVEHATGAAERKRLADEADFAFRQAWALCPYSPEVVYRYVNFLMSQQRIPDALLITQTASDLSKMKGQAGGPLRVLLEQLKKSQGQN